MIPKKQCCAALVAWIDEQPLGVTAHAIRMREGWNPGGHSFTVLAELRERGLLVSLGRSRLARWCTPRHLDSVKAWHAQQRDAAEQRNRESKSRAVLNWSDPGPVVDVDEVNVAPINVVVYAGRHVRLPVAPRWVFDLGGL